MIPNREYVRQGAAPHTVECFRNAAILNMLRRAVAHHDGPTLADGEDAIGRGGPDGLERLSGTARVGHSP